MVVQSPGLDLDCWGQSNHMPLRGDDEGGLQEES